MAVFLAFLTVPVMNIDLSAPIWSIDHVAAALLVSSDTAREHTYSHDFPKAKAGFSRSLWLRGEVLSWFAALPATDRGRRKNPTASATTPAPVPIPDQTVKASTYTPRGKKSVSA